MLNTQSTFRNKITVCFPPTGSGKVLDTNNTNLINKLREQIVFLCEVVGLTRGLRRPVLSPASL